jgi:hypothetical protein
MKHNYTCIIALLLLLYSSEIFSQKIYIDLYGGYGFPLASQAITTTDGSSSSEDKLVKGTYGKGMNVGLGLGYKVTKQIGVELGASYFNSATIKAHDENNSNGSFYMDQNEMSASIIRITPALRLTTTHEHVNAYAKVGFVIGVNGLYENKYNGENTYNAFPVGHTETNKTTYEFKGRLSTGFSGCLGFLYDASQQFSFFIEANGIAHSWAPKNGEITEYEENGHDELGSLSVSEREVEFVDQVTENSNPSPNEPYKVLRTYIPLSAIFINAGFQFRFGGTSNKKDATAPPKS